MNDISEGMRALEAVKAVFPGAILAGGYLRDAHFGRSAKDIDIFVPHMSDTRHLDLRYAEPGSGLLLCSVAGAAEYMEQTDVNRIFDFDMLGYALPVQVVMMAPGVDVVQRCGEHDFDFCQIWHDGWVTRTTIEFRSMAPRVVTLTHCEDAAQFARSMRRWDRLKAKYPDFELAIPQRFQCFVSPLSGSTA